MGPSIGLDGALANPLLELHGSSGGPSIATNDNWKQTQEAQIRATSLQPQTDLESAIVTTLDPGGYTAIMRGAGGERGVGLVEVYDLDGGGTAKLANISTRGFVGQGTDVLIGGIIITGSGSAKVVVRGIGPSTGLSNALKNPLLELHNGNGDLIFANDNWKDNQEGEIRATNLQPLDDREATIVQTLTPGAFTAILAGVGGTTGLGLIEVYRISP